MQLSISTRPHVILRCRKQAKTLALQAWACRVLPHLRAHLAQRVDSVLWQPLLAQESLLCNMLEVALYHGHACGALSEDAALELCDYCGRKLAALLSAHDMPPSAPGEGCPTSCAVIAKGPA